MKKTLTAANAVVAARGFNPSVFSQLWLVENGIASRDDVSKDFIYAPPLVQLTTAEFTLVVFAEQIQITPKPGADSGRIVQQKLGTIVDLLPHTPYVAAGLNFCWQLELPPEDLPRACRSLFFRENSSLFKFFDQPDARFGGYMSRDIDWARLRLEIKPAFVSLEEPKEALVASFNFNRETAGTNAVNEIQEVLSRWKSAEETVATAIESLEREWNFTM
ncbi:MAG TPA: hypothetical protein VHV55_14590 [Pirellulales bacterium]|jgi:hypothetical protein|nr:hypothetical protein [Pirellulales bacterium]